MLCKIVQNKNTSALHRAGHEKSNVHGAASSWDWAIGADHFTTEKHFVVYRIFRICTYVHLKFTVRKRRIYPIVN